MTFAPPVTLKFNFTRNLIICLFLFCSYFSFAQWPALSTPNVAISTSSGNEHNYWACPDGFGGSICVWEDDRGADNDIYSQRIDRLGAVKWVANGISIAVVAGHNHQPMIVEDGSGSAIMCWRDERGANQDIYAQSVNGAGVVQWAVNGIAICSAAGDQDKSFIVGDGSGGAIIAWEDDRGANTDIYAQKVNAAGVVQWTVNGVLICGASNNQNEISMVSDGAGGAVLVWTDKRSGKEDIYTQYINNAGVVQWAADGVALCTATNTQKKADVIYDGSGNYIAAWEDKRTGSSDIYSQKINSAGVVQWVVDGVGICTIGNSQVAVVVIGDSTLGAVFAWEDKRSGTEDVYAQRINSAGVVQWVADGMAVSTAADVQKSVHMSQANNSATLLTWEDKRTGSSDIYVQIVDASGASVLGLNGLATCTAAGKQSKPFVFYVGFQEWISVWTDERLGNKDLYAQGYNSTIIPALPIQLISFDAVAVDNTYVKLSWITASEINNDYYTLERSINGLTFTEIGEVNGAGNSSSELDYEFLDKSPLNGTSYYRLKQTDFNGDFEFFDIKAVDISTAKEGQCLLKVYPNPCNASCTVELSECPEKAETEIVVQVVDASGNIVDEQMPYREYNGSFAYHIEKTNNLKPGIYFVRGVSDSEQYADKIIVK